MGFQWPDAATWLRKALDSHEVASETTDRDLENEDNSYKVATDDEFFLALKSRRKKFGANKAMIVAFVVVLAAGARYIMSRRSRSYIEEASPDDMRMQEYWEDFNNAADKMKEAWGSSELAVRQAFQLHFTPSLKDGQELPEDPLASISAHVEKMRECKERRDFAQHLQLLQSICRTVTTRLEELKWFVRVNEKKKIPVPVPGHDEPCRYPSLEALEESVEGGLTAANFLGYVGLVGGEPTKKVDGMLAHQLLSLLAIENKHNAYNSLVRYSFEHIFQPFRKGETSHAALSTAKYQIPYAKRAFRIGAFVRAAAHLFRECDSTLTYANERKMHRIADNWTRKGVLEASKRQEKQNANKFEKRLKTKREQMQALLKQGIPKDDLVIDALFLL
ncbi:uncharacterized protein EMH_0005200 [Eimeria mitis]|uniref:Transmembrane protein n=1 Tax=Eimeria mitis TaxID=44415 RepID=U6K0Y2_9EIME|nr:uncharacterized protein EMH_0005200 [Eimeria mitis]CDJ29967.1 hypothetical protein, conserved [Eimeria mitis]